MATLDGYSLLRLWDIGPDERPVADLIRLAQFLAAHRIDRTGALVPLLSHEIRQAWMELYKEYPQVVPHGVFEEKPPFR